MTYHSTARMASVVSAVAERVVRLKVGRPTKSINEALRDYRNALENLVVAAANGTIRSGAFAEQMRQAIIDNAQAVYLEGMREAGIKDAESELDDTDNAAIRDWILSQTAYINSFRDDAMAVNKLTGDERTNARNAMLGRVDTWAQSLESLGRIGSANAQANMPGTWQLGDTEKHCRDCAKLDGQRHRLRWFLDKGYIPQQPGSETLECGGWNCDCQIVDDDGKRLL